MATSAAASGGTDFSLHPAYGVQGSTLTLTGATFTGETAATINGITAAHFHHVNAQKVTIVVPAGATSGPVVVTGAKTLNGPDFSLQQQTTATATLSRSSLTFTQSLVVTGDLTEKSTGHPVSGQPAVLQHRVAGSTSWHRAKGTPQRTTGSQGQVGWTVQPAVSGAYRVAFKNTPSYTSATTSGHKYALRPLLSFNPQHTVPVYSDSVLRGRVRPHLTGTIYLWKQVDGVWKHAGKTTAYDGRFSFTIHPDALGPVLYRVVRHYDGLHAHAQSATLHLQVVHRELVLGDSGSDVKALQKRLRKLHYWLGSVSKYYGDDTLHAVTAFEKVQKLPPNGEVTMAVWNKLNHPRHIHLRHPHAATYEVEVNIGRQVLLMAKDGHITHILDTSTAGGYLYKNSEGGISRAITPTGHFSIQYKLTGTRVSKLGTLYYPSYFTDTGYAIHGEGNGNSGGEVPPYPNSHGCVRITDDAVLHFFSSAYLAVGASVWIYH
ncbi:MAG TPA: L,D-transpeptidase family protein [Mycobacteriales bacterium]|nr:L,D-transpeptidase family protein [Mycobacteriales bacterium]